MEDGQPGLGGPLPALPVRPVLHGRQATCREQKGGPQNQGPACHLRQAVSVHRSSHDCSPEAGFNEKSISTRTSSASFRNMTRGTSI